MSWLRFATMLLLAMSLAACTGRPGYVLPEKQMAELLADIYTAEAVTEMDRDFHTDSAKMALKQSVFERNRVNPEQFDTSLVWYGHNIDKYIELYDRTIEILEKRNAKAGSMLLQAAISMAGDSVDVWPMSRFVAISPRMPAPSVAFDLLADDNWERGDVYVWRSKLFEANAGTVYWTIAANYDDGTIEYLTQSTSQTGWNEVTFTTDSTKQMTRLRGLMQPVVEGKTELWADSISLVRKRKPIERLNTRYRQKTYPEYK